MRTGFQRTMLLRQPMNTRNNRSTIRIMRSLILTVAILSLAACQWTPRTAVGRLVTAQDRICLENKSAAGINWGTRDMNLMAQCQIRDQEIAIAGDIFFAFHLIYNYSSMEYFRIYVYFMDDSGRVFQKNLLAVNSGHMKPLEDIRFNRTFKLPEAVGCLAFEYDGRAFDDSDDSAIGWWFSHSPALEP